MSAPWAAASASSVRLVWRALRATSVMPFLWPSSSSSTIMGRKMSCSSKRNRHIGSCSSTLVSSTNSLAGPDRALLAAGGPCGLHRAAALAACGSRRRNHFFRSVRATQSGAQIATARARVKVQRLGLFGQRAAGSVRLRFSRRLVRRPGRSVVGLGGQQGGALGGGGGQWHGAGHSQGWGQKAKKPPGEPGGFFGFGGDDAGRRDQRHEFIMHKSGDASTTPMLLQNVRPPS
jgi:hypothetical protein